MSSPLLSFDQYLGRELKGKIVLPNSLPIIFQDSSSSSKPMNIFPNFDEGGGRDQVSSANIAVETMISLPPCGWRVKQATLTRAKITPPT
jgi:hypothetical protein